MDIIPGLYDEKILFTEHGPSQLLAKVLLSRIFLSVYWVPFVDRTILYFRQGAFLKTALKMLRYFNFEPSEVCRAPDLSRSQIPVTTGGFELRTSCIRSSYLTH